jgi:carboxymethylenebutenolidase
MAGEFIDFSSNGAAYTGYHSSPTGTEGHGIVVIQEWWGLVPHIQRVADRFAYEGFHALAPDFYQGVRTDEPELAGKLMMALNIGETEKILAGAVDALLQKDGVIGDTVGVVGFCMGGQLALYAATINPKIGACVDFYGIHPNVSPQLENLHCPVMGIFAEFDEYAPPAEVSHLEQRLSALGKAHEFHTYPGTQHAFFNDDRPEVYNREASEDAWERVIAFFRQHLR